MRNQFAGGMRHPRLQRRGRRRGGHRPAKEEQAQKDLVLRRGGRSIYIREVARRSTVPHRSEKIYKIELNLWLGRSTRLT